MFRTDRDALAQEVEDLRRERAELRTQNEAMRADLLARRQAPAVLVPKGNIYKRDLSLLTQGERFALTRHQVTSFPVWAAVLLHFVTGGLFTLVHFSRLHDQLPHAEHDDPSMARSIGFSFIPYFFIYWIVFNTMRLADRVNLQLRLRGRPNGIPRGLAIAAGVSSAIPHAYLLLGFPIFWPIAIIFLQRAVNQLAALSADGEALSRAEPAPPVRVPLVRDLPGPADVAADVIAPAPPHLRAVDDLLEIDAQAEIEAAGQPPPAGVRRAP